MEKKVDERVCDKDPVVKWVDKSKRIELNLTSLKQGIDFLRQKKNDDSFRDLANYNFFLFFGRYKFRVCLQ